MTASCFEVHHLRFRQRGSFRTRAPSGRECSWLWNNWCFPCKRKQFEKCRNTSFLRRRKQFAGVGFSTSRRCSCFLLRSITATFPFSPPLFFAPTSFSSSSSGQPPFPSPRVAALAKKEEGGGRKLLRLNSGGRKGRGTITASCEIFLVRRERTAGGQKKEST